MNRILLLLAVLPLSPIAAQDSAVTPHISWTRKTAHVGKWVMLGAAAGFTAWSMAEHNVAEEQWHTLLARCRADNALCALRSDGSYRNYDSEVLYQETLYYDHRARRRLLVAEASLLAAGAFFVLDWRSRGTGPRNIPLQGLQVTAEPWWDGALVGLRVRF